MVTQKETCNHTDFVYEKSQVFFFQLLFPFEDFLKRFAYVAGQLLFILFSFEILRGKWARCARLVNIDSLVHA